MFVAGVSKSAWHAVGEQIASLLLARLQDLFRNRPGQARTRATGGPSRWSSSTCLSDRRDLERLMDGFRRLGAMQMSAALREATSDPFPASYSDRVRTDRRRQRQEPAAHRRHRQAARRAGLAAPLDDRQLHRRGLSLRPADDATTTRSRTSSASAAIGVWHATCTCRMGADDDPMAVTDNQGRVRGVSAVCGWSTPRCSRRCPAPTPISRP